VLAALLIVAMLGVVAFAVDMGYIMLVRTQLQVAADSAAMAAAAHLGKPFEEILASADEYAGYHSAGGKPVDVDPSDVELGSWDSDTRTFTPSDEMGNAVRVTTRRDASAGGEAPLFFARIFGNYSFSMSASAVAMANPRDIAFVVDLSGSMNDDTEPCWATGEINKTFTPEGYPTVGSELMQKLYDDFGFGNYPGAVEYLGERWGVPQNKYAYAELTKDNGPLAGRSVPRKYRINSSDSETVRKRKAYSAIIDGQIAKVMPNAKPTPNSKKNYKYWEKYLDYIVYTVTVKAPQKSTSKKKSTSKNKSSSKNKSGGNNKSGGSTKPKPPKPTIGCLPPGHDPTWYADWAPAGQHEQTLAAMSLSEDIQLALAPGAHDTLLLSEAVFARTKVWRPKGGNNKGGNNKGNNNKGGNNKGGNNKGGNNGGNNGGSPGTPPANRGTLPPNQDSDRIHRFNNPNKSTFPQSSSKVPRGYRNNIGYVTYVQFMMDHGRDLRPQGNQYVPLSKHSRDCPWHAEQTAGGSFRFPARTQPMHAARRALIAAINVVKERNAGIANSGQADWVSIVAFDTLSGGGPVIEQSLTADYDAAMRACTQLQAVGDKGATTATETGLETARLHIRSKDEGGHGRLATNKVVVLLTDGVPNLYSSSPTEIQKFIGDNPSDDYYNNGAYWLDAPLMQAAMIEQKNWHLFPVGVGLGTEYGFMDRLARMGATANDDGESPRGSGNPAEYEQRLTDIFEEIITNPQVRLVQ